MPGLANMQCSTPTPSGEMCKKFSVEKNYPTEYRVNFRNFETSSNILKT